MLALDSAQGVCAAGIFEHGKPVAQRSEVMQRGQPSRLPMLVAEVLEAAGQGDVGLIAVTVGPGSFTGLRAALSLAHGLAAGWAVPIVGVTVAEALARDVPRTESRIWVVLHSRPGRVFLAEADTLASYALDALPAVAGSIIVTGNAAAAAAAELGRRGDQVHLHPAELPSLPSIAAIGLERHQGRRPPLSAQPLYVDAPEARPPTGP